MKFGRTPWNPVSLIEKPDDFSCDFFLGSGVWHIAAPTVLAYANESNNLVFFLVVGWLMTNIFRRGSPPRFGG